MASMLWAPPLVVGQPGPLHLGPQTQPALEVLDGSWEMGLEAAPPLVGAEEGEARSVVLFSIQSDVRVRDNDAN